MNGNRKAKPTVADLRAAKELKRRWLAIPKSMRPTQEKLGERYGEGGSQSLISQYMNGVIPLNAHALMFFARQLGCSPEDIYPDHPSMRPILHFYGHGAAAETDQLDREWHSFDAARKRAILDLISQAKALNRPKRPKHRK